MNTKTYFFGPQHVCHLTTTQVAPQASLKMKFVLHAEQVNAQEPHFLSGLNAAIQQRQIRLNT